MRQASKDYKNMPDFMKPEYSREKIRSLGDIYDGANRKEHSAKYQPGDRAGRHIGDDLAKPDNSQPTHHQVDAGSHPAGGIDHEHFHDDPGERKRPDCRQNAPPPETLEEIEAYRSVGSGYQEIDRCVIEFSQSLHDGGTALDKVVNGGSREHHDQAYSIN